MKVTLLAFTPDPTQLIEEAASTCYHSNPSDPPKLYKQCYKSGHQSVLEHVNFTFKIEGVSRALLAQLTRHRVASFSVQSQRYVDAKEFGFAIPDTITNNSEASAIFFRTLSQIGMCYTSLQEMGIPNEDCRAILPNATTTVITMTMNLRELIHLCNERLCNRAQLEIRRMTQMLVEEVNKATGNAFKDMLVPKCEKDINYPYCPESSKDTCHKHPRLKDLYAKKGVDKNAH